MAIPEEMVRLPLPTWAGEFDLRVFEGPSGHVSLLLVRGELGDGRSVLTRLHSGCLTGDALGSLRCDCGPQLRLAMRRISAEGRGALLYASGHEGRGIGLLAKLRAYVIQDQGQDTVDANRQLGLPVDGRDYREAVQILLAAGIRSIRLLTNNPEKVQALSEGGLRVECVLPIQTSPHVRNLRYLETKRSRLSHQAPAGEPVGSDVDMMSSSDPTDGQSSAVDATRLLGQVRARPDRPYVVLKYAQTLDGRIAAAGGDAKWISGAPERRISHAMRAACDAVLVGRGTVLRDDPLLTVRMVPGASPIRVILDSALRVPSTATVFDRSAATLVLTSARSSQDRRDALRQQGVRVEVVRAIPDGVDLDDGLARLLAVGIRSVLVEGGARVITSLLRERLVDRVVVSVAPVLLGKGIEAVGDLGMRRVVDGLQLANRTVHAVGDDVLIGGDLPTGPRVASRRPSE
jgi:GTP cyclohydrolase II